MILIASDKTKEIELKRKLEEDEENIKFINKCLQNPLEFVDLIFDSNSLIQEFKNTQDKKLINQDEERDELFRKFHTLKARFGQFSLKTLTEVINHIETEISNLEHEKLQKEVEAFEDSLQVFIKKNRLIVEAANKFLVDEGNAIQASEVYSKAKEYNVNQKFLSFIKSQYLLSDLKEKFHRYQDLIDEIAEAQGKSVEFIILGDTIKVNAQSYSEFINSTVHVFRNMIDHGIEAEEERASKSKPTKGTIKTIFKLGAESFSITFEDDGKGINPQSIKEKLIDKQLRTQSELESMKDMDVVNLIFLPGFSTKEGVPNFW